MHEVTLSTLVTKFGTNLLAAKLMPGTNIKFMFYGKECEIVVGPDGREDFNVIQKETP